MKISMSVPELQEVIKKAQKCMVKPNENKNAEVLHTVKLSALENSITITTDTLNYSTVFELSGSIQDPGEILLNSETLKLITKLKNTYEVIISDNLIQAGNKTLKFSSIPVDQFPKTLDNCTISAFSISQPELIKALSVNYASGFEENRPIFNSVCIDQNTFVATDTHRMTWYKSNITNTLDKPIIIPFQVTKLLASTLINKKSDSFALLSVDKDYKHLKIKLPQTTIITRLIDGTFVNYKQVIPKDYKTSAKVNVKKFLDELSFLEDIAKQTENNAISIAIDENSIYFDAMDAKNAVTINIESDIIGEQIECIGIDYKLLIDALKNVEGEDIEIKFNGAYSPVFFNNSIVCPLRIKARLNKAA